MDVYTYSEARQKLSSVLDKAESTGKVLIRRKDGRTYALTPERPTASPLDVPSIEARNHHERSRRACQKTRDAEQEGGVNAPSNVRLGPDVNQCSSAYRQALRANIT